MKAVYDGAKTTLTGTDQTGKDTQDRQQAACAQRFLRIVATSVGRIKAL